MMENNAPGRGKLKVTGIIYTVLGALSILGSLLILGAGGLLLASDNDVGLVLGAAAGVFSVLGAVSGVFYLVIGILGIRNCGRPENCGANFVLGVIVLVLVVVMHLYMNYTKHGYEIAVIGDSINTARYAGMNVGHVMMRTMFLSGAISGLVGFIVASGANTTLYDGVAAGVGFTSITVAWLSQLNAFAMIAISMMLAVISKGAETLQTRLAVPASISDIITGILLFCMLGCEFFINYRLIFRSSKTEKEAAKE